MFEPPEVHHERLFLISVLGFIVNLIGIFVFQHGGDSHHGHSHGTSSNSHAHSHDHSHDHHGHSHDHNEHAHSDGGNKIFEGVFLHILADTMGKSLFSILISV